MNFNRMIIKNGQVYRLQPSWNGRNLGGGNKVSFNVPYYAKPLFSGSEMECVQFIAQHGALLVHA